MFPLGGRWWSDLHSDRSLILPSTLMTMELSGDTGAAMPSYIHVQSVWGNTSCHNNYDRTIETIFLATVSLSHWCSPWLALVACKVIVISHNFITWWHKAISVVCALPHSVTPKGSSHHMCTTTPCHIDKVMLSLIALARLVFCCNDLYHLSRHKVIWRLSSCCWWWFQESLMAHDCGL